MRAQGGKEASGSGESERDFLGMASSSNESRASSQRQPRRSGRGTVSRRRFQTPLRHEVEGGNQRRHPERLRTGQLSVKAFAGSSRAAARAGQNAPRRAASSATPKPSARCSGWKVKKVVGLKGNSGRPVRAS